MAEARGWRVHPDETGRVDEEELISKLVEVATIVRMMGGVVALIPHRVPVEGGFPGEQATVAIDIQWVSNTRTKAQPEGDPTEVVIRIEPPATDVDEPQPEAELEEAAAAV